MKQPMPILKKKKPKTLLDQKPDQAALLEMMQDQKQGEVGDPEHDEKKASAWMMLKPMMGKLPSKP